MPFPRPTLTTLRTQAMQDINASDLPNADGFLRRAALRVLAWVQAGFAFLHYGYLDWIAKQATPFTADSEFLDSWAAIAPTPVLREQPTAAGGTAQFSGSPTMPMLVGTLISRNDGFQYATSAVPTVSGGTVAVAFVATTTGSVGNADTGIPLTLANPIEGLNSAGAATSAITGGTDVELDPALKGRMLESYANPPSGGAAADYVTWALEVPGVTRAWTLSNGMGAGTVVVYFTMDAAEAAHNGFPQGSNGVAAAETRDTAATGDQLALANYLFGPTRQPVTALVYAVAPTPQTQAFTFSGLAGISSQQQAAVSAALASLLVTKGDPRATVGVYQSDVDAAVGAVPGLPPFSTTSPTSWPLKPSLGSLLTVGAITYA